MIGAELQKAIFAALTGANIAGGRVYDSPPPKAVYPYVTIGDEQALDDGNTCEDGWEVFADVHAWSRPVNGSKVEVKALMASIVPLLAVNLTMPGFRSVAGSMQTTRALRDPDGLTEHGIVTLRYLIDPA